MRYIVVLALLFLVSCDEPVQTDDPMEVKTQAVLNAEGGNRIKVEQLAYFKDDLAYHGWRKVYVVTDTKTGKKYFGVTGVGIAEVGEHTEQHDKTTVTVPHEH